MLEAINILKNLTARQINKIEQICELQSYSSGDYILREGDQTTDLYFIISGKVDFYKTEMTSQEELKFSQEMSVGESFGELAFFDGLPRSCSVKAKSETQVYVLSRQKFLLEVPDSLPILNIISTTLIRQLILKLRSMTGKMAIMQKQIDELTIALNKKGS